VTHPTLSVTQGLQCPVCQGRLAEAGAGLTCAGCGQTWPLVKGVAQFGEAPDFPQDFSPAQIEELLGIAETAGWQAALHDHMRPLDPRRYRHAVDEYRAQWRCLVPRRPDARILDFRCGWGPVAVCLAEDYGEVVAADTSAALARFTALRAQAVGAGNLRAVSLDPRQRLPFTTGYFNVVVLEAALEWGEPDALLREVSRVLAPGGVLFVNVPNQLNAAHLLQTAQGWLKRPQADRARDSDAPVVAGAQPLTLSGYRRALARAGFGLGAGYAVLPSVAEPFYLVPLGSGGSLQFFLDNLFNDASLHLALAERHLLAPYQLARALWQGLRFLPTEPVLRHFMPGYALLASRP
jgi:SAM-dependent methyltransferase